MTWTMTDDFDKYLATVGDFLREEPVRDTVLVTVAEHLRRHGINAYGDQKPLMGWWRDPAGVLGAALLQTPPHPLNLSRCPDAAVEELVEILDEHLDQAGRINLAVEQADVLNEAILARTGVHLGLQERNRLYRLGQLTPPDPAPAGSAHLATAADRDMLVDWYTAFMTDIGHPVASDIAGQVDSRIPWGGIHLWRLEDGTPVSMAFRSEEIAGMTRIGQVYTPVEHRGRGYGAGVTAAVSQAALDAGIENVLLFTDLANLTSNGIYIRLGYQPVTDRVILGR